MIDFVMRGSRPVGSLGRRRRGNDLRQINSAPFDLPHRLRFAVCDAATSRCRSNCGTRWGRTGPPRSNPPGRSDVDLSSRQALRAAIGRARRRKPARHRSVGRKILRNLREAGFAGPIASGQSASCARSTGCVAVATHRRAGRTRPTSSSSRRRPRPSPASSRPPAPRDAPPRSSSRPGSATDRARSRTRPRAGGARDTGCG